MAASTSHGFVLAVFGIVYLGMILGGLPRLQLDRTGVALLGAIAVVGAEVMTTADAAASVHLPTLLLLFSFMVISAQMRLGGFYAAVTRRMAALPLSPTLWLGLVIGVAGGLSAVFTNDVVCLAMAPVLTDACLRRRLDPVPYLLALACASNIGSAATLIGNPQNMLIGAVLKLSFGDYLRLAAPPVLASLLLLWLMLAWRLPRARADFAPPIDAAAGDDAPPFDGWQTAKGLAVMAALMFVFLLTDWPREVAALVGAGLLLLSRRFHSSRVMHLVDWSLLVLFMGLFVVNQAMEQTGLTVEALRWLRQHGLRVDQTGPLLITVPVLSNLVSNVPAVMLLLPALQGPRAVELGPHLALISTLAGNLLIVGSIANIIVVDAARQRGIVIDWKRHAATGVPVTLASLALLAVWVLWR
jgi:Na+/H+ antiporter NhaD/arsenite permease-like protein